MQDCLEKLENLFCRTTEDFASANALCDVLFQVECQAKKYIKMRQLILNEHYTMMENGNFVIKGLNDLDGTDKLSNHLAESNRKFEELDEVEFEICKTTIPKPLSISPRELYYLREFFDFK